MTYEHHMASCLTCRGTVREKDFDLRQMKTKLDETNKSLHDAKENLELLEAKVADLHHQLRGEIKRNQQMEEVSFQFIF